VSSEKIFFHHEGHEGAIVFSRSALSQELARRRRLCGPFASVTEADASILVG